MPRRKYPTPQQVGRAGELFVAAELNRRGAHATLFLINTPGVDVVVSSPDRSRTVSIQVKTKGPRSTVWQGNINTIKKDAKEASDLDFIVFVDLKSLADGPNYYVLQLRGLAQRHSERHQRWVESKGGSRPRSPASTHTGIQLDEVKNGKDDWELLGVLPGTSD